MDPESAPTDEFSTKRLTPALYAARAKRHSVVEVDTAKRVFRPRGLECRSQAAERDVGARGTNRFHELFEGHDAIGELGVIVDQGPARDSDDTAAL